ncbi:MAG: hypothetical protein C7B45_10045 [Sulfobacillus acidophilus]|uniref:AMP-dependent synthetase/ligase domain-containing protein n=1 Tax=Sulfobacillus acidophilus TaxID=53633 RepID=A0A2T2WHE6_9FIRM|nr:MAG: hypothetical protein C7B45_10045 [Sulfobacillus acidophilus]
MSVQWAFQAACDRTPKRLAVVQDAVQWSYHELFERALALAGALQQAGLKPGDRILVGLHNTAEHVALFMATQVAGLVYVPINFRAHPSSVRYFWEYVGTSLAVMEPNLRQDLLRVDPLWAQVDTQGRLWMGDRQLWEYTHGVNPAGVVLPNLHPDDLSMILFTSGTTGKPKGIPLTHTNVMARTLGPSLNWDCPHDSGEQVIGLMPLYHTIGLQGCVLYAILQNNTYYPVPQFSPASTLSLIQSAKITHLFGTPTHLYALVTDPAISSYDLFSLRQVLYGGAPMSPHVIERCAQALCPRITYVYGNTETYNALYHREAPRTFEQSVCGVHHRVRVVAIGGGPEDLLPIGQEGELIVDTHSPESFKGYWQLPEKTAECVRSGWYFTGDSCRIEGENVYRVTGRVDDMILSGAENNSTRNGRKCFVGTSRHLRCGCGRRARRTLGSDCQSLRGKPQ